MPKLRVRGLFQSDGNPYSQRLVKGEIEIEVRRLRVDRGYIPRKTKEAAKNLSIQIYNIVRFNEEHISYKLTSNIQGGGSLLHAAIQLEEQDLVKKLIELGANPMTGGAEKAARKAQEKLHTTRPGQPWNM